MTTKEKALPRRGRDQSTPLPSTTRAKGGDYAVGYGRPPAANQFQKGRSGNPKGRPPGSQNVATILRRELDKAIAVTEAGRACKSTKREVIIKQQVNNAAKGNIRSVQTVLGIIEKTEGLGSIEVAAGAPPFTQEQAEALTRMAEAFGFAADKGACDAD